MYLVKIALCFDLSASYPLTMAPGREIIENTIVKSLAIYLQNRTSGYEAVGNIKYSNGEDAAQIRLERLKRNISNCVRIILVFVTLGVAQIKTFGEITNLVGGFSLSSLAFIVPPIMFVQQFSKELLKSTFGTMHFAYAVFILVFGFAAVGLTTYESIREFFEDVPEPANCLG